MNAKHRGLCSIYEGFCHKILDGEYLIISSERAGDASGPKLMVTIEQQTTWSLFLTKIVPGTVRTGPE